MSALNFDKFLLFGDSITEFSFNSSFQLTQKQGNEPFDPLVQQFSFGSALASTYVRKMDIVQRGFSGYNSRWALKLLPPILKDVKNIKIAYIFFGSNDSCLGGSQKVPIEEFVSNSAALIEMLQKANIKPILITPAVFNAELWNTIQREEVERGFVRTMDNFAKYAQALVDLGSKRDVPVVNLNKAFLKYADDNLNGRWQDMLCDGLHYSGHGSYAFYNELIRTIEEAYPEYAPKNVAYRLPNWRDVHENGENLEL